MHRDVRVLGLCGSLRAASWNSMLLRAASRIAPTTMEIRIFHEMGTLPLFNPDLEATNPAAVALLRSRIMRSDAVIIASPEYAHGISGVMKNALDWMVGNESFVDKPVALFNTSPRASIAQDALKEILRTMSARIIEEACITVPLLGSGLDEERVVAQSAIRQTVLDALAALERAVAG
jgi:chromate reductase